MNHLTVTVSSIKRWPRLFITEMGYSNVSEMRYIWKSSKILLPFDCVLPNHYNTDDTNAYDSQVVWIPRYLLEMRTVCSVQGIHSNQSFYKSVHEYECDLDNVGPLKHLLPGNNTMQAIKFSAEDETWILGKYVHIIGLPSSLFEFRKNLLIHL